LNSIPNQKEVCTVFNNHFINVANDIGTDLDGGVSDHSSVNAIKIHNRNSNSFNFTHVSSSAVTKILSNLDCKKSVGADGTSAKLLKHGSDS